MINPSENNNGLPDRLDGIKVARSCIDGMISAAPAGMKVMILDAATTQIVSAVYSQTEMLQKKVYLVRTLQQVQQAPNGTDHHPHAHAICFLRPTPSTFQLLATELRSPHYTSYSLYCAGPLDPSLLSPLATADATHERLTKIHDYACPDAVPVAPHLWHAQCGRQSIALTVAAGTSWAPQYAAAYERHVNSLSSLLATFGAPVVMRYAAASAAAEEVARDAMESIQHIVQENTRRQQPRCCVLVVDRRDDPVTPLLSQWTYQAMVHELLGLNNHRVVLKGAPGINTPDLEEVVLSPASDPFFAEHQGKNFGELGEEIQRLLHDYQKQQSAHSAQHLQSIEEMQSFMEKFPEVRSQQHTVSKHVAIMGELSRIVETCNLLDVSALEQGLACHDDHSAHWRELMEKLNSNKVKLPDKLRLGLLYALRYEHVANLHMLQQAMSKGGVPPDMVQLVPSMLRYAGSKSRGPGLYKNQNADIMRRVTQNLVSTVQGIENVYTQHTPLLIDTLQSLIKGKLTTREYPVLMGNANAPTSSFDTILVCMVGGITYEEGAHVAEWNSNSKANGGVKVVLAGSTVHNSTSFLDELKQASAAV